METVEGRPRSRFFSGVQPFSWFFRARGAALFLALLAIARADAAGSLRELRALSLEDLTRVEVTSVSRRSERLADAAAAVQVLTGDRITRAGAFTLPDALRLATGVQVSQISGREWALSARGFASTASEKMEVALDGRTLYSPLFSGVAWDVPAVMFEDLDRIEVIHGPGAALWGSNAVNGVVSIVTKSADETQGAYAAAGVSERGEWGALRHGGRIGGSGFYRVYTQASAHDGLELASGAEAPDALTMRLLGWRSDHYFDAGAVLTLQSEFYDGEAGQIGLARSDLRGGHGSALWDMPVGDGIRLRAQAIYDWTRRDIPAAYAERRETADVFLEGDFNRERYGATLGVRAKTSRDRFADRPALKFDPPSRTLGYYSVYAHARVALAQAWQLTTAAAVEHNSYTGAEFQPTLRLAYQPPSGAWMAWIGASRAVRTPSRIDRDVVAPGPPPITVLRGSDTFRSETLDALEAGWRWQRGPGVAVHVNAFLNRYRHLRSLEPATFPVLFRNDNLLAADTAGIEANASVRLSPTWRVIASGRMLSKDMYLLPESRSPNRGTYQGNDARRLATLQVSWDARPDLQIDAVVRHVSELPAPVVPAYVEADLRATWRISDAWELAVIGRNVLHARHQEWSGATQEYIPRSFWLSLSWRR